MPANIHKATPSPDGAHCAVCGARIKRVPGGQGPTWVHADSGAVAAPNPPVTDEGFVVMVDCGYSEWFGVRDVRMIGDFASEEGANQWAAELDARGLMGREGEPLKISVQPMHFVTASDFEVA